MNRTNTIRVLSPAAHVTRCDGLLGLDYLRLNAAIYPVAGSGLLVKPGAVPAVSISSYLSHLGYTSVPLVFAGSVMIAEGHLEDHPMRMAIDTGAGFSTFDVGFVRTALGRALTLMEIPIEGVDRKTPDEYRFTPKEIDVGGFRLPPIQLAASQTPSFAEGGINAFMGQDLMGTHRAIVDLGDSVLWLK